MSEEPDLQKRIEEMALTIRNVQTMVLQMKREMDNGKRMKSATDPTSTEYHLKMLKRGCQSYEQFLDASLESIRRISADVELQDMQDWIFQRPKRTKAPVEKEEVPADFPLIKKPSRTQYSTFYIPDNQSTLNFPTKEIVDEFNAAKFSHPVSQRPLQVSSASTTETRSPTSSSAVGTDSVEHSTPLEKQAPDDDIDIDNMESVSEGSSSELDESALSQMLPQSGFVFGQSRSEKPKSHLGQSENPYGQLKSISRLPKL